MPRSAAPLSSHGVLRTTSVDVARTSVSASLAPHRLLPVGGVERFRALHNAVDLAGVSLHFIDYGTEVEVAVDGLDFQLVQIPLAGRTAIDAGAGEVVAEPGVAAVTPVGHSLRMRYSGGNPRIMVRVAAPLLRERQAVAREGGIEVPGHAGTTLDLTRGAGRSWRGLVDLLLTDLERPDGLAASPAAAASLRLAVVDGLVAGLAAPGPSGSTPGEQVVRRAARLIELHCAEPLGTPDVAEAVHLSVRALQAGFRAHLGATPMAYLRRVRLERVRESLADGSAGSVTEAALRWGVSHLGRLSVDYRAAFGESPNETLRRAR